VLLILYFKVVDPKKEILLIRKNQLILGNTGPFIQYTYARIQSIIRKANFDFRLTNFNAA
jgi:arginyl-tRNA synthetase